MNEAELAKIEERSEHWDVMGKIGGEAAPFGMAVTLREADYEALVAAAHRASMPTLKGLDAREAELMERWYQREEAKDRPGAYHLEVILEPWAAVRSILMVKYAVVASPPNGGTALTRAQAERIKEQVERHNVGVLDSLLHGSGLFA